MQVETEEIKQTAHHSPTLTEIAQEYIDNGISVIPLALDGSKKPALSGWKTNQTEMPTAEQVRKLFQQPRGMGVVCGVVSGGLEVLVVFSSNAGIEPGTYTASSYLAHARYRGDFKRANQAIKEGVR